MGRRCVLEIQDDSQITASTISQTYGHSTIANSQEVYQGDSNNDRQSKTVAETVYVCMYISGFDRHLDFHNEWVVGRHSFDVIHLYFAMFENNNATFYGNPLCAIVL